MKLWQSIFAAGILASSNIQAAEFQVNIYADSHDADLSDGICADAQGECTLRAAVEQSNSLPGADQITLPAGEFTLYPKLTLGDTPVLEPNAEGTLHIPETLSIHGAGIGNTTILIPDYTAFIVDQSIGNGTFTLSDISFKRRYSMAYSSVIKNDGNTVLEQSEITGFVITPVINHGDMHIVQTTLKDNNSINGGAISNSGTMTIENSALINNVAQTSTSNSYPSYGGALYNSGSVTISNTTLSGNSADYGGAILSRGSNSNLQLNNVTIANNVAKVGATLDLDYDAKATISASILSNGASLNCATTDTATITSGGYNIDSQNSCGFEASGDQSMTDPRLSKLGNFGGNSLSMVPLNGSPAIDVSDLNCLSSDQRGITRPKDGNGDAIASCDIGAHERIFENHAPVADVSGPYVVMRGTPLTLDGSRSYDLNPDPLSYSWDFGDGTSGDGISPSHIFSELGTFTSTLSLYDGFEQSEPASTTVTVLNNPPIANAGPTMSVEPQTIVTLNGTGSTDPDGQIVAYSWRLVGGDKHVGLKAKNTATPSFRVPHVKDSNIYQLEFELTVTDNDGAQSSDRVTIYIGNYTPPIELPMPF